MTKEEKEKLQFQRKVQVAVARTFDDLLQIEKQRGYASGWAYRLYNIRQSKKLNKV
jgi:hypothetical protein